MTVRNMKKQLFLSAMALMVSLVCLTSATYAWFSLNTTISANGLQISASMDGVSFEITEKCDGTGNPLFTAGQTLANVTYGTQAALIPTHPDIKDAYNADITKIADWNHAFSTNYSDAQVTLAGDPWANVKYELNNTKGSGYLWNENPDNSKSYFAMVARFYVRLNPDASGDSTAVKNVKAKNIKIVNGTGSNLLSDAVYLVVSGPKGSSLVTAEDVKNNETVLASTPLESDVLIEEVKADGTAYPIVVFAFFDGRDEDCTSSNYDPNALSISLDFAGE